MLRDKEQWKAEKGVKEKVCSAQYEKRRKEDIHEYNIS